jgi:hypothetical protein
MRSASKLGPHAQARIEAAREVIALSESELQRNGVIPRFATAIALPK